MIYITNPVKVNSNGQATILTAEERKELGIKPGTRIRFVKNKEGKWEIEVLPEDPVQRLKDRPKPKTKKKTLTHEELEEEIAKEAGRVYIEKESNLMTPQEIDKMLRGERI